MLRTKDMHVTNKSAYNQMAHKCSIIKCNMSDKQWFKLYTFVCYHSLHAKICYRLQ